MWYISRIQMDDWEYTSFIGENPLLEITDDKTGSKLNISGNEIKVYKPLGFIKAVSLEYYGVVTKADLMLLDIIQSTRRLAKNASIGLAEQITERVPMPGGFDYFLRDKSMPYTLEDNTILSCLYRMYLTDEGFILHFHGNDSIYYYCDMIKLKRFLVKMRISNVH